LAIFSAYGRSCNSHEAQMIWALTPAPIRRALAWAVAGLAAVWAIRAGAKREARAEAALRAANYKVKAHELRNEVENRIAIEHDAHDRLRSDWQR
jgi:hypothetical protein